MINKNKTSHRKAVFITFILLLILGVIYVNYRRLNHNTYPNYEKTVDYGRVRENKIKISPIITALFFEDYEDKSSEQDIFSYLNHLQHYQKHNIKMIITPPQINDKVFPLIEKMYAEIFKHNNFNEINIFYRSKNDMKIHKKLLGKVINYKNISLYRVDNSNQILTQKIEESLAKEKSLTVVINDLYNNKKTENFDNLSETIIDIAQKHHYRMQVFDLIDSQIAEAIQKDYANLFSTTPEETLPELVRQKNNLTQYANLYGKKILDYFRKNFYLACQNQDPLWPPKNKSNYRLYDRGTIYIETDLKNERRKITTAKKRYNNGIIHSLISISNSLAKNHWDYYLINTRVYLLTERESITEDLAITNLDTDDGIYAVYGKKHLLVMPDEYQKHKKSIYDYLGRKFNITSIDKNKIKLYKFKIVEIKDEN